MCGFVSSVDIISATNYQTSYTGFSRGSHSCGTLSRLFLIRSELDILGIGLYGTIFGQDSWKFLLDLSNKDAIESSYRYIKFISLKKESIKCLTAMRTPGKLCKTDGWYRKSTQCLVFKEKIYYNEVSFKNIIYY